MKQNENIFTPIITVKPADIYISINDTVTNDIQKLTDTEWRDLINEKIILEVTESGQKGKRKEEATNCVTIIILTVSYSFCSFTLPDRTFQPSYSLSHSFSSLSHKTFNCSL